MTFDLVGIDGDDTLWHCQRDFDAATEQFALIVEPWVADQQVLSHALDTTERNNLTVFGFGVKTFALSMVEAAIEATNGRIPARELSRLVELAKSMMTGDVEVFSGVSSTLEGLAEQHRLVLVTKGDLLHQRRKLASSGLADYFHHIEIVPDKTPAIYAEVLRRQDVAPHRFVMVGDSAKSDVIPVLAIGGRAVHVPSHHLWSHEHAELAVGTPTAGQFSDVPGLLADLMLRAS